MSELSDKYKAALDSLEISPDFKERTAAMMKKLRDSGETLPLQISEEDVTKNVTALISENESRGGRIAFYRIASAAAAAAACLVIGVSVNRAGVFDSISTSESTAEAFLDTIDESYVVTAEPVSSEIRDAEEVLPEIQAETVYDITETDIIEDDTVNAVTLAETPYQPESAEMLPYTDIRQDSADTAEAAETMTEIGAEESKKESRVIAVEPPMSPGNRETAPYEYIEEEIMGIEEPDDIPPLYEATYDPPAAGRISDEDEENDIGGSEQAAVSQITKASDFSAENCISRFRPVDSEAVITPLSGSFPEETVPVRIKGRSEIRSFEDDLAAFTAEHEAQLITVVPTDSRYIIDFSDSRGNTMRIYVGVSRYICYSSQGSMYSFELTEEEYSSMDEYFLGLLSADK